MWNFDGRYIYIGSAKNTTGQLTRYDTTLSFTSASSYSVYDTTSVDANAKFYISATFDGRYMYLNSVFSGIFLRYDTSASFTTSTSYTYYNTQLVNANSVNFWGIICDSRYVYFVPNNSGTSGQITRYDTTLSFTSSSSYTFFDTTTVNVNSK